MERIFIVPNNDLEAKTIIELLEKNGEDYIVTGQAWGASWEMLEPEVFEQLKVNGFEIEDEHIAYLREFDEKIQEINSEISKLNDEIYGTSNLKKDDIEARKQRISELEARKADILDKRQKMASQFLFSINRQAYENGIEIYGIELTGNSMGAIDIDHHNERSNEKSSIEQVAEVIGIDLTDPVYRDELFVAANDKGAIQAMEELGKELEITGKDLIEIITFIRNRDRQAQGITVEQEAQAQEAIEKLGDLSNGRDYVLVDGLPHSKTATIMDRLYAYGIYGKNGNVLIISKDGETNFYGSAEIIAMLDAKFKVVDPETGREKCWKGGLLEEGYGFWGGYADQEAIKQAVQEMIDKIKEQEKEHDKVKEFWLKKYSEDKIGTVAKLSQAMQHGAWLREWQRIHGEEPRIKPITKKVNGEKVKIGEADIAVPWSKLPEFFRQGNEYGDIETVKFLSEKISNGDISQLSQKELYTLSEKENVKWSDGKHSLNPFQGYLYEFIKESNYALYTSLGEEDYGHFYPLQEYVDFEKDIPYSDIRDMDYENDDYGNPKDYEINDYDEDDINIPSELEQNLDRVGKAFSRYYTTRFLQKLIRERNITEYKDFLDFDITSVTTPEQIDELDEMLEKMVNSPEIEKHLEAIEGNAKFEEELYDSLRTEVMVEIKKDSDRIENAHKVFVALETGNMDELLADPETAKWAREVYEEERRSKEIIDE